MHESVKKHYEPRPLSIRNTADNKPLDEDVVDKFRRIEQAIGCLCTQPAVSATIVTNE
jgi:hypothetical protein